MMDDRFTTALRYASNRPASSGPVMIGRIFIRVTASSLREIDCPAFLTAHAGRH